jgi:hypothetical protein
MNPVDRILPPYALGATAVVSTAVAGWLALTFIFTVAGAVLGT